MSTPGAEHSHSDNPQVSYTNATCPRCSKLQHTDLSLASYSALMAGQMEAWSDMLENIKRHREPVDATDLDAVLDWSELDRIVCRMRETAETWSAINSRSTR